MTTPNFEQSPSEQRMISRYEIAQFHNEQMDSVNHELAELESQLESGLITTDSSVPVRNEPSGDIVYIPYVEAVARATGKLQVLQKLTIFIIEH